MNLLINSEDKNILMISRVIVSMMIVELCLLYSEDCTMLIKKIYVRFTPWTMKLDLGTWHFSTV